LLLMSTPHKAKKRTHKTKSSSELKRHDSPGPDTTSDSGESGTTTTSASSLAGSPGPGALVAGTLPARAVSEANLASVARSPLRMSSGSSGVVATLSSTGSASSPSSSALPPASTSSLVASLASSAERDKDGKRLLSTASKLSRSPSAVKIKSTSPLPALHSSPTLPVVASSSSSSFGSPVAASKSHSPPPPGEPQPAVLSLSRSAVTSRTKLDASDATSPRLNAARRTSSSHGLPVLRDDSTLAVVFDEPDVPRKPKAKRASPKLAKEQSDPSLLSPLLSPKAAAAAAAAAGAAAAAAQQPATPAPAPHAPAPQPDADAPKSAAASPAPSVAAAAAATAATTAEAASPAAKPGSALVVPKPDSPQLRRLPRRVRKNSSVSSGSGSNKSRSALRRVSKVGKDERDAYDEGDDAASHSPQGSSRLPLTTTTQLLGTTSESDGPLSSHAEQTSDQYKLRVAQLQTTLQRYDYHSTWLQAQLARAQTLCQQQKAVLDELVAALHSPELAKAVSEKRDAWLTRIELHADLQAEMPPMPRVPVSKKMRGSGFSGSGSRLSDTSENAASGSYTGRSSLGNSGSTSSDDNDDDDDATTTTTTTASRSAKDDKKKTPRRASGSRDSSKSTSTTKSGTKTPISLRTTSNEGGSPALGGGADEDDLDDGPISPRMGAMMLGSFARTQSLRQRSDAGSKPALTKQGSFGTLARSQQATVIPHFPGLAMPKKGTETFVAPAAAAGSAKLTAKDRRLDFNTRGRSLSVNAGTGLPLPSKPLSLGNGGGGGGGSGASHEEPSPSPPQEVSRKKVSPAASDASVPRPSLSESSSISNANEERRRSATSETSIYTINFATETVLLHEALGKGGSASVYRAAAAGFSFACKVYHAEELSDAERVAAERDVAMMEALAHPNVLRTLGHKHARLGRLLLYVELAGGTLADSISMRRQAAKPSGFLPLDVLRAFAQVINAIDYLHSLPRAIVHRDIKSENVFVAASIGCAMDQLGTLQLKLGDFDSARYLSEDTGRDRGALWRLKPRFAGKKRARLSMNVGTPEFMAPEMVASQKDSGSYDEKVDVWSSGMVLFELLTLDVPFRLNNLSRFELLDAVAAGERPKVDSAIAGDASLRKLWKLWSNLTEFDAAHRYSAASAAKTVRKLLKKGL
jgi:trimeric autotransporter adhesin